MNENFTKSFALQGFFITYNNSIIQSLAEELAVIFDSMVMRSIVISRNAETQCGINQIY